MSQGFDGCLNAFYCQKPGKFFAPVGKLSEFFGKSFRKPLQSRNLSVIIPNLTVNRSNVARKPLVYKGLRVFDDVLRM